MEWFTLSPRALKRLQEATQVLRTRLGTSRATEKVQALGDEELRDFVSEVLSLMDESEAILERVRPEAPEKKPIPQPYENAIVVEAAPPRERTISKHKKPITRPFERERKPKEQTVREKTSTRRISKPFEKKKDPEPAKQKVVGTKSTRRIPRLF